MANNNSNFRFTTETINAKFGEKTWRDVFTAEEHDKMRAEFCKWFDTAWNSPINVESIAKIRGVSTSGVVTFISNDVKRVRLDNLKETILGVGAGKPKVSEEEKAINALAKKLGLSAEDIRGKLGL